MNNIGRLVQRLIQPKTSATAGNAFLCTPRVGCNFTPGTSSGSALVNSIQKSWFSNLLGRRNEPGQLLALPPPVSSMQVAGFKVKVELKRRCKDCYFVVRQNRRFVICATHPRHKQMAPLQKPRTTWIVTHATQSKVRPW